VTLASVRSALGRDLLADARAAAIAGDLDLDAKPGPVVTDEDLAGLPQVAVRYLRRMGVVGRPRDRVLTLHARGRFRPRPRLPWLPYESWQIGTSDPIGRVYRIRVQAGPVPLVATDRYLDGRGTMHGEVLGLMTVVDAAGPEMDAGELVTWCNDAVLLAPSMLLGGDVRWAALDDHSFGVTVADRGIEVTARVVVDDDGAPTTFETFDRYVDLGGGLVRTRWSTPVDGWATVDGRLQFVAGSAVWETADGPYEYARTRLGPGDVVRGGAPSTSTPRTPAPAGSRP